MRTTIAPRLLGLFSIVAMVTVEACMDIEDIPPGQCGNAIVDEGEDCDTHARHEMACYPASAAAGKACRYDCSSSPCSGGYACGSDQVCRAASGQFQMVFAEPSAASSLLVADFDGDAQQDVCATADDESSVHYLGPGLRVDQTTHVRVALKGKPVAGHLTVDDPTSASDIALLAGSTRNAVGVLRGRDDRSFSATAYPSISIPVPQAIVFAMDAAVSFDGEEAMSLVRFIGRPTGTADYTLMLLVGADSLTPGGDAIFALAELADSTLPPLVEGDEKLIERVPVGQLDEDLLMSPCEEYVLAFRGEHLIRIGTPCRGLLVNGLPVDDPGVLPPDEQIATLVRHVIVDLPPPLTHGVAEAHVFDLDGDGHLDVLISPDTEGAAEARSAWAAYGPFHFGAPAAPSPHVEAEPYPWLELSPDERLLSVARIDEDAAPDFVTSRGVLVSRTAELPCPQREGGGGAGGATTSGAGGADVGGSGGSGAAPGDVHHCPAFAPASKANHFQHGVVGDFDGSGRTDVALATGKAAELLVYLGQQGGLVEHLISTSGDAHDLAVGDFDGDGFDDIGFAEDGADAVGDTVSVCFGRPVGPPEPPTGMGRLGEVEQVISSTMRLANTTYADALDDLGVVSTGDAELLTYSSLQGSTDRLLQAPFYLAQSAPGPDPDPDAIKPYTPSSLAIGHFAPDLGEHADLAALALHRDQGSGVTDRRLWLLEAEGDALLSQTRAWPGPEVVIPGWDDGSELLITIDIDGDGTDEVVGFGPLADGGKPFGGALLLAQARPDPTLGPNGAFFDHVVIETQNGLVVGRSPSAPAPPVIADVDGNGYLDVVTLGAEDVDSAPNALLVVLYNRSSKDGSVAVLDALRVEDEAVFDAPPDTTTFAVLQMDADKPLELVAFARDGAYVVETVQGATPQRVAGLPSNVRAAAAVDLDGDGLAELVLAGSELQIWRSSPVEP